MGFWEDFDRTISKTPGLKEVPEAADAIRRYVKTQQRKRLMHRPLSRPGQKSTNRRTGTMKFKPKAKLDTSQIIDKRDKKKYTLTSYDPAKHRASKLKGK